MEVELPYIAYVNVEVPLADLELVVFKVIGSKN